MPVIQSKGEWNLVNQESEMKKGKLVRVQIGPNQFVKMREADVNKMKPAKNNKIAPAQTQNKQAEDPGPIDPGAEDAIPRDDLTEVPGIGKASERLLNDNGVLTFDQLLQAGNLEYLSANVNQKIDLWRADFETG